jgi:DNA-binding IclR family transcriptional regulator
MPGNQFATKARGRQHQHILAKLLRINWQTTQQIARQMGLATRTTGELLVVLHGQGKVKMKQDEKYSLRAWRLA